MRISDWSSDVCSSDLALGRARPTPATIHPDPEVEAAVSAAEANWAQEKQDAAKRLFKVGVEGKPRTRENSKQAAVIQMLQRPEGATINQIRSEEHTSELQSLMRNSHAFFFLKNKNKQSAI